MTRTRIGIRRADSTDLHTVTDTIAAAFETLAVAVWLVSNSHTRKPLLYNNFLIHVAHALTHGDVWTTLDGTGCAVWFRRDGTRQVPPIPNYDQRLDLVCGGYADRFRTLDTAFDAHHPVDPHHHLAFLAVRPDRQRHGIGRELLAHHLWELDHTGVAAYLEASSVASRTFYLAHGFTDHGAPIDLPDGPRLWPMWRHPKGTAPAGPPTAAAGPR